MKVIETIYSENLLLNKKKIYFINDNKIFQKSTNYSISIKVSVLIQWEMKTN